MKETPLQQKCPCVDQLDKICEPGILEETPRAAPLTIKEGRMCEHRDYIIG